MMARVSRNFAVKPPSPAFVADSGDIANSHANSYDFGHDANLSLHQLYALLRRHGVASHLFVSVNTERREAHRFPPCKVTDCSPPGQ
jgi:hypothetical protein